jgi:hypothetical protein
MTPELRIRRAVNVQNSSLASHIESRPSNPCDRTNRLAERPPFVESRCSGRQIPEYPALDM